MSGRARRNRIDDDEVDTRVAASYKSFPVAFVVGIFGIVTVSYLGFHCQLLLQERVPVNQRDRTKQLKGQVQFSVFVFLAILWVICYVRAVLTLPGTIPNTDDWTADGSAHKDQEALNSLNIEKKRTGERRQCKWCSNKYKPDRCHHCRICRMCILKMDHHCPWIYNCVGYRNHKYFFLLLLYSCLALHLVIWTMWETARDALVLNYSFFTMFVLLFGESLAVFLGILLTGFFGFHIWLMLRAMTTIEFCEKSSKRVRGEFPASAYKKSSWVGDIQEVLGKDFVLWLLPVTDLPPDGGLTFVSETTILTTDMSVGRAYASRQHKTGMPRPKPNH
mmetsp:Transcript_50510/g.110495  ORF Transcript_50510/g.110495 Transcript_50510/m.110495 type:complete len:334 (-) Transcript_50510:115-1116(-)